MSHPAIAACCPATGPVDVTHLGEGGGGLGGAAAHV